MLPQSQEDITKARIYRELSGDGKDRDIFEYLRECRIRYEESRNLKPLFRLFKSYSLEEGLISLGYEYANTGNRKKRKRINGKAYNLINRCKSCKDNPLLVKHFYRIYREIRRGISDLIRSVGYIEDSCEELETDNA